MYAVIDSGGKQARVEIGETLAVELLAGAVGDEVTLTPRLVVDGSSVVAGAESLAAASVTATVVGSEQGPKITGFTYKAKARARRRFGHRQRYTTLRITGIELGATEGDPGAKATTKRRATAKGGEDTGATGGDPAHELPDAPSIAAPAADTQD